MMTATGLVGALLWSLSGVADEPPGLSVAEFRKLHRELTTPRETWQSIPWQLSLLEARDLALRQKKPIYMLVRSGHPLGCV
jgi:hypothetical protein